MFEIMQIFIEYNLFLPYLYKNKEDERMERKEAIEKEKKPAQIG
jgi:hypothetical protein